jgi:pimeloyl-ACP methyl ester carboxylesterase
VNPCYFGRPDAPLFGMYRPPRVSVARKAGVLLCPAIGLEYMRTHYAMRLLAKQLAIAGFHVLRFDYHGTGDSAGEIAAGQYEVWVQDVALAARELEQISGAAELTVVGLRMGALFALESLSRQDLSARGVVLWDPVVAGDEYIDMLAAMHQKVLAGRGEPDGSADELLGTRFPADLRAAIGAVDLKERLGAVVAGQAALAVSEDRPEYAELQAAIAARWPGAAFRLTVDQAARPATDEAYDSRMTGPIIRAVAEAVESLA